MPATSPLHLTRRHVSRRSVLLGALAIPAAPLLAACGASSSSSGSGGSADPSKPLVIAASSVPHAEILRQAQSLGLLPHTTLEIREITGDLDANALLESGDIEVNYFQHAPYEKDWSKQHGVSNLVDVAAVHVEPLGLYSQKVTSVAAIPDGSTIAVPNNVTNFARALFLLQSAKVLTLDAPSVDKVDVSTFTDKHIVANPKNLKITQVDAPQLPRTLADGNVAAAVINGNYALEAKLDPSKDAIALESAKDNPYANVVTTTSAKSADPRITALAAALKDPKIAAWITATYHGAVLPVVTS